jgi:hypothetical protein
VSALAYDQELELAGGLDLVSVLASVLASVLELAGWWDLALALA